MTLLEQVVQVLNSTGPAGGVHYAVNMDEPLVLPYITLLRVSSTTNVTLQGPSDLQTTRIQIDVYAETILAADALLQQASDALLAAIGPACVPGSTQDSFEPAIRAMRITRDFSIMSRD